MDTTYINDLVGDAVAEALAETARIQPADPVDFVGKFLIKYADTLALSEADIKVPPPDTQDGRRPSKEESKHEHLAEEADEPRLIGLLKSCDEVDGRVLLDVVNALRDITHSSGCYIASKVGPAADTDQPQSVQYIAASTGHEFMLENTLKPADGGAIWKAWVAPVAEGDDQTASSQELHNQREPLAELPMVNVTSVLHNPDVYYFSLPKPGSFLAVPLVYGSLIHEDAFPTALPSPPEDSNNEQVPVPAGITVERQLAICVDTVGLREAAVRGPYTGDQVSAVRRITGELKTALLRTEQAAYEREFEYHRRTLEDSPEFEALREEETAALQAAETQAASGVDDDASEEAKASARCNAVLGAAKQVVLHRMGHLAELATHRIPPKSVVLKVLNAAFASLGHLDKLPASWPSVKQLLQQVNIPDQVQAIDAGNLPVPPATLRDMVSGTTRDDVMRLNPGVAALLLLVNCAADACDAVVALRKREELEAAEKAAKEAAEAAAAAAAAASAAESQLAGEAQEGEDTDAEDAE